MKKIMIAFASALVLAACGTANTEATTTADSTTVATDSTSVDTVAAKQDTTFYKKVNAERKAQIGLK
jgi:ABC-type glycerol-3-phosphate transport system substrate-binding protein